MLNSIQLFCQFPRLVIVDEGEHADRFSILVFPFLDHEPIPDQIANSLGAIRVAQTSDQSVKSAEQV